MQRNERNADIKANAYHTDNAHQGECIEKAVNWMDCYVKIGTPYSFWVAILPSAREKNG
jgi:hypothetical protein